MAVSHLVWQSKYRGCRVDGHCDDSIDATWHRVAATLARVETNPADWEPQFYAALADFRFLPGGRILAGAGTRRQVTLFNCFVMGTLQDSLNGIFDGLKEGALTMQQGGGVGYDFSTLRPKGLPARETATVASGPVSFMRIWDSMCATLLSTSMRRGAMMGTLRCDHPDIEAFVEAKRDPAELRNFNLSVLVTDAFLQAVAQDRDWPLVFPDAQAPAGQAVIMRTWPGFGQPQPCRIIRTLPARALWERILRAAYDVAEPGVIFIDRINRLNNLWYAETISATNPCGEIPLPPYGACDLGSINLTRFVQAPFTPQAALDFASLQATAAVAVRMLDNVYAVAHFPLAAQREVAQSRRRLGLGLTGLADALVMLGMDYGSDPACRLAGRIMRCICHAAYRASIELAKEKGAFALFDAARYSQAPFIAALPGELRAAIRQHGIRNSHLTAIAPTGSISLLAGNVSSGLEPVFDFDYRRNIRDALGVLHQVPVSDYAWQLFQAQHGHLPPASPVWRRAADIAPLAHLHMQAALQPYVDNSISKTINVAANCDFTAFREIYMEAYRLGLKGCTVFRPNPVRGEVLLPGKVEAI